MNLQYYPPQTDLREYVRAYYYFATDKPALQPLCAELGNIRIMIQGGGKLQLPNSHSKRVSDAFLIGPTMGAYRVESDAGMRLFGIGIRPRGWATLFGIDAAEAADSIFDLTALVGSAASQVIEEIRNAPDSQAMACATDRFLSRLLNNCRFESRAYPYAIEYWLLNSPDFDLDGLIDMMDLSRRQTDRVAKRFFGASPKFLQRKYRALRAADWIRSAKTDRIALAGSAFYDQSHFIKEFKSFIGVTPGQFVDNQAQLITEIQARRRFAVVPHHLASV